MQKSKAKLLLFALVLILIAIAAEVNLIKSHYFQEKEKQNSKGNIAHRIFEGCSNDERQWRTCYAKSFGDLTTSSGFTFSIDVLREFQKIDPKTRDCHFIAHRMADAEITKNPQTWEEFLGRTSADECIGGFIHGAIEAYRRSNSDVKLDAKTVEEICSLTKTRGKSYCSHMMGHLLPVETVGAFRKAVDICAELSKEIQYNCFTGVFMENITRDNLASHGLAEHIPYNEESTLSQEKLCRNFSGEPARGCWQEITHYYQRLELGNPKGLFKRCGRADSAQGRDSCFLHGVTFMAGAEEIEENNMLSLCSPFSLGQEKRTKRCVSTIIFVLLKSSPKFEERIGELCRGIEPKYQEFCNQKLLDAKRQIFDEENIDSDSQ